MSYYTRADLRRSLSRLPIGSGDILFCHSNLGFFGNVDGIESKSDLCEMFFDEIMRVIGVNGTIVVPTFTYSFQNGKDFDVMSTPSNMGVFSEWIRIQDDSMRSCDPCYSVAAIGKDNGLLTTFPPENVFDMTASFFSKFFGGGGKILNFNFDAGSTLVHFVERCCDVPYRFDKRFTGNLLFNGVKIRHINIIYVRYLHPLLVANFEKFHELAMKNNMFRTAELGRGMIGTITAADTYRLVTETLQTDPWFLTEAGKVGEVPTDYASLR